MSQSSNRRQFVGAALAATGAVALGMKVKAARSQPAGENAIKPDVAAGNRLRGKKVSDRVMLGQSGVKVSMIGIGTGTVGSRKQSNQTRLGDEGFKRIMRHALDNGVNFFDLADQYGSNPYFGRAMQGVPRDQYVIQTKIGSRNADKARQDLDRILQELQTDYIDSLIIHCVTEGDWTTRYRGVMDVFSEAKQQGKIRSHGVTCHSFAALQAAEASDWVQLNMVRWNAQRSHMDADVETARALFQKMRAKGQGMIAMKVMGEGSLLRGANAISPEQACRFQVESGITDAFVIGVESTEQLDQVIRGVQTALDEFGYMPSPIRAL